MGEEKRGIRPFTKQNIYSSSTRLKEMSVRNRMKHLMQDLVDASDPSVDPSTVY